LKINQTKKPTPNEDQEELTKKNECQEKEEDLKEMKELKVKAQNEDQEELIKKNEFQEKEEDLNEKEELKVKEQNKDQEELIKKNEFQEKGIESKMDDQFDSPIGYQNPKDDLAIKEKDIETHLENVLLSKQNSVSSKIKITLVKKDEEESSLCVICMENEKKLLLIPCGHYCLCEKCKEKILQCPICRKDIQQVHIVYS